MLKANFTSFIPLSALRLSLKGLMRRFILHYGPVSLVPKRREPWTNAMIPSLVMLPVNLHLGPIGSLAAGSVLRMSWRSVVSLAAATGFRKAEMFKSNETTFPLTWDLVSWVIQGAPESDPSEAQLRGIAEGDYVAITPVPSKSDQSNTVWGAHHIFVPFHDNQRNAAAALAELALIVGSNRRKKKMAVFVDNVFTPLSIVRMATALFHAMCRTVGVARAKLFTWHSARIALASVLPQCNVPDRTIQAMLRW